MSFHNLCTLTLVIAVILTIFVETGNGWITPCTKCHNEEECNQAPPDLCIWGEHRNYCGRRVCSKGPGEKCGEKFNIMGVCGEGMRCSLDGKCRGCHIPTMICED